MTEAEKPAPTWHLPNMQPTLNKTGFMFKVLDEFADDFIQYAGQADDPVLDLGCAYGVATIATLRVTAVARWLWRRRFRPGPSQGMK